MKKFDWAILFFLGLLIFCSAQVFADEAGDDSDKTNMSYAFGMVIAMDLFETGLEFDYGAFIQGFSDIMESIKTRCTEDEAMDLVDAAFLKVMARQEEQRMLEGEKNRAQGEAFLAANALRPGVEVTPSGLHYELIAEGTGELPGPADWVIVHYRGTTIDGFVFDSSYDRGEPMEVPLDRVIPGWSEGLRMTREGGKARLYIPPDLAYGESGAGGIIAPSSVIIFDVELFSIIRPPMEDEDF